MTVGTVTDSKCDLDPGTVRELDIRLIPLRMQMGGRSYVDGVELTWEEFYRRLPEFNPPPTTAAPGPEAFQAVYEELGAEQTHGVPVTVLDSR